MVLVWLESCCLLPKGSLLDRKAFKTKLSAKFLKSDCQICQNTSSFQQRHMSLPEEVGGVNKKIAEEFSSGSHKL